MSGLTVYGAVTDTSSLGPHEASGVYRACELSQSCPTLCDPMDYNPPGSSVHGIFQARIVEWVAFPPPGDIPNSGMEPVYPASLALADGLLNTAPPGKLRADLTLSVFTEGRTTSQATQGQENTNLVASHRRWGSDPTGHLGTEQGQTEPSKQRAGLARNHSSKLHGQSST